MRVPLAVRTDWPSPLLSRAACARDAAVEPRAVEEQRLAMGSSLHLTAWTGDEAAARAAFASVFAEFERLEALLSIWREGSDVQRLNAAAGAGTDCRARGHPARARGGPPGE